MTVEQIAQQAMSLRDNDAFNKALAAIRSGAIDRLVSIDPAQTNDIIQLQATVKVVDDIRDNLEQFIRSGTPRNPPGIA